MTLPERSSAYQLLMDQHRMNGLMAKLPPDTISVMDLQQRAPGRRGRDLESTSANFRGWRRRLEYGSFVNIE